MDPALRPSAFHELRSDIVRIYVLDGLSLEQLSSEVRSRSKIAEQDVPRTRSQWTTLLRQLGISKNISRADANFIWTQVEQSGRDVDQCIVLTDGVLRDLYDIKKSLSRMKTEQAVDNSEQRAKRIVFLSLPISFGQLRGFPGFFESFRRLLWYTNVHFDRCFSTGEWTPDEQGVYGRSNSLVAGLRILSQYHNMHCDALKHLGRQNQDRFWALTRTAFSLHESIVQTLHHRQFPDILAISLILERHRKSDIRVKMAENLRSLAMKHLPIKDPRQNMFQELIDIPMDKSGDLYLAFDSCCRGLWMSNAGNDPIKAYYSYNQASLPRMAPGKFYDLFKGKSIQEIHDILHQVDERFSTFDHARFCLWHTALRYLLQGEKNVEAENIGRVLRSSLTDFENTTELLHRGQLNVDAALTFFLLGSAQDALSLYGQAIRNFKICVRTRSVLVKGDVWDPTLAWALERLKTLGNKISDAATADECNSRLSMMYSAMEREDLRKQLEQSSDPATREWIIQKARDKRYELWVLGSEAY